MDLLGRFTFILILTQQGFVSAQFCFFDGENDFININVKESSELVILKEFLSDSIEAIVGLPISNEYVNLTFFEDAGRLDVELIKSLKDYFKDPNKSNRFNLPSITTVCDGQPSASSTTITIIVNDENNPPEFEASNDIFKINYPWCLDVPINYDTDIFSVDWDYEPEFSNQILYTTSEPRLLAVESTPKWNATTPRPRRNSLKIKLLQQLTAPIVFNVIATDADLDPVVKSFTIDVAHESTWPTEETLPTTVEVSTTPSSPGCSQTFNNTWGTFSSPEFPLYYPFDSDCEWRFFAPQGFRVHITLGQQFSLEHDRECAYDYLEFRDGPNSDSTLLTKICGQHEEPLAITSSSNSLYARFHSDDQINAQGFAGIYQARQVQKSDLEKRKGSEKQI